MSEQSNDTRLGNVAYVVRSVEGATAIARGNITNSKIETVDEIHNRLMAYDDIKRELDEAREEIRDWKRLHDAAERGVDLTIAEGTISDLLKQRDEARRELKFLWRERDEARELLASEKITRNHIIKRSVEVERERDEARESLRILAGLVAYGLGQSGEEWSLEAMRQATTAIQNAKSLEAAK
jgi:hypothetical protein